MTTTFDEIASRLADVKLEMYSTQWCPDCTRLKKFLKENGVTWDDVLIDEVDGAAQDLEAATGKRGVPYLKVNDNHWVRGYHLEHAGRFDPSILATELSQVL